ncbi:MAG: response regulator [Pseudomonadota bacterium]
MPSYMDVIYFVYGQSFFALGLIVTLRINRYSHFELMPILWWLAGFGFVHGGLEWIDLWQIVHGDSSDLALIRPGVLVLSFLFLFEFGRRLIRAAGVETPMTRAILLYPLWVIGFLAAMGFSEGPALLTLEIAARYLLGFPGATLSALGLILYHRYRIAPIVDINEDYPRYLKPACEMAAIGFLAYGLAAGLVVPRADGFFPAYWLNQDIFLTVTGMPVQLARAGCAILITIAMSVLLRLFHAEILSRLLRDQHTLETHAEQLGRRVAVRTASLERSEARLQLILDTTAAGICGTDAKGRITFINQVACEMLGYTAERLIGRHAHEMLHHSYPDGESYPPEACPIRKSLAEGTAIQNGREIFWRADGQPLPTHFACKPLWFEGRITGAVVSFLDITAQIEAERAIQESLAEAQRLSLVKSQFLANMSHEIRTPMNAIIGMAYLCLKTDLTHKQQDYASNIHQAGVSLLGIINDILDFSKIEAGKLDIERIPFKMDAVTTNIANMIAHRAFDKGLELLFDLSPAVPRSLIGDPLRLGQVLTNLLGNAIKFTEQGDIHFTVEVLERRSDKVDLRFSIRDTGIGMTREQTQRLFQAFSQADGSTTRKYGGTGLGLSISKHLVELMGGRIGVESEPGRGSTFTFSAWFDIDQEGSPQAVHACLAALRVLVADDNDSVRKVLRGMLETLVAEIDLAASGAEAIAAVRRADAAGKRYDLVLMDWQMPELDGIATAQQIKADTTLTQPPPLVMMVTAFSRDDINTKTRLASINGFLVKPVSHAMLVESLNALFAPEQKALDQAVETPVNDDAFDLAGLRVLLTEDNKINQLVAIELLESWGVVVTVANNGQEALEKLDASDSPGYDLILMDLQMPVMDGYEATRCVRAQRCHDTLPIIAMTAHAMVEEQQRCRAAGMNAHVSKPIDPAFLYNTLKPWHKPAHDTLALSPPRPPIMTAEALPLPAIPGLDVENALRRLSGNVALYRSLWQQFDEQQAGAAAAITAALDRGDRDQARRTAHQIKGIAGNLGATPLGDAAALLETAIERGVDDLATPLVAFSTALMGAVAAVRDAHQKLPPDIAPALNPVQIAAILDRLARMASEDDAELPQYFLEIRPNLSAALKADELEEITAAINAYDFPAVLASVRRFRVIQTES